MRLGRNITPQFYNIVFFDPFGANGVGATEVLNGGIGVSGPTAVRASNQINYFLPRNLGGFYGHLGYWAGENPQTGAATEDDGNGVGARVGFSSGPFDIALAHQRTDYATGDVKQTNVAASWKAGFATITGVVSRDESGATDGRGWMVGGLVPVGRDEIRLSYSQYRTDFGGGADPRVRKVAVGYVHNLSKRTAIYGTYAHLRNRNGANMALNFSATGANTSSSGVDLGLRHSF